ncbi:hypothetical protein Tco_0810765 [Tanacetum coccineum]
MNSESTSNSQFPGFSSQAPMTPEQLAFLQTQQQAAFVEFQQNFQNQQQNPPQFSIPQQQSQSSNSLSQTESQQKRGRVKHAAKKGKLAEPIGDVTLRWKPGEETLLAKCFIAVSEDRNVGKSQSKERFGIGAIYKRCSRLTKSGENEVDLMKRARGIYRDENKNNAFNHEDAWAILQKHSKWDAPDLAPVDLTEGENVPDEDVPAVNTEELFGSDARPRPPGKQRPGKKPNPIHRRAPGVVARWPNSESFVSNGKPPKRRLRWRKRDRTVMRLEELRFLALGTKDLSDDDAYYINLQKNAIKEKLKLQMPRPSNNNDNNDDDDE